MIAILLSGEVRVMICFGLIIPMVVGCSAGGSTVGSPHTGDPKSVVRLAVPETLFDDAEQPIEWLVSCPPRLESARTPRISISLANTVIYDNAVAAVSGSLPSIRRFAPTRLKPGKYPLTVGDRASKEEVTVEFDSRAVRQIKIDIAPLSVTTSEHVGLYP